MDQGHGLAVSGNGISNCCPHQALGAENRDGFDGDARIFPDLLLLCREHLGVQEVDQLPGFGSALLPLDADIDVFSVLAKDHHVELFRMLNRRRDTLVVAHGTNAGIQVEYLAQGYIQRAEAAAERVWTKFNFQPEYSTAAPANIIPDFPVINKSFNFSYSGNDR